MRAIPRIRVSILVTLMSLSSVTALASVRPVDEGFGAGVVNDPDWIFSLDSDETFTDDGYMFDIHSLPGSSAGTGAATTIVGVGGFVSRVELLGLSFGDFSDGGEIGSTARMTFSHILDSSVAGGEVKVQVSRSADTGDGLLLLSTRIGVEPHVSRSVPAGADVALEIRVDDLGDSQLEVNFGYDENIHDAIPAQVYGSGLYNGVIESEHSMIVRGLVWGSDGAIAGTIDHYSLRPLMEVFGDLNADGRLDVDDVNLLGREISSAGVDLRFDIDGDGAVEFFDLAAWIHDVKQTFFGDANLDGEFASSDLVNVFTAGEYEDDIELNSNWETGDWNGDRDFTTSDLVLAFQDGGYEQGPKVADSVPEPRSLTSVMLGLLWLAVSRRKLQQIEEPRGDRNCS